MRMMITQVYVNDNDKGHDDDTDDDDDDDDDANYTDDDYFSLAEDWCSAPAH